jgi:hypothetical protein
MSNDYRSAGAQMLDEARIRVVTLEAENARLRADLDSALARAGELGHIGIRQICEQDALLSKVASLTTDLARVTGERNKWIQNFDAIHDDHDRLRVAVVTYIDAVRRHPTIVDYEVSEAFVRLREAIEYEGGPAVPPDPISESQRAEKGEQR